MKTSVGPKTIIHPNPVLIIGSYNADNTPNIMSAAWGGICCSEPPCIAVSLRQATQTLHNIVARKAFTVGIPSITHVREADFVGLVSGKDINKFTAANLTAVPSNLVDAPYVDEFPYSLECKLIKTIEIGLHTQFIGEIVDIKADPAILNAKGVPDIEKVRPFIYGSFGNRAYYAIGEQIAQAFTIGRELQTGDS